MDALKLARFLVLCAALAACGDSTVHVASRNKFTWPFSAQSIWNTPIGSAAKFAPANIMPVQVVTLSPSFLVKIAATDPMRPLLAPAGAPDRCGGTQTLGVIQLPQDFVLPAGQNANAGNSLAIVQPDGHSLIEISGFARCLAGGPAYGFRFPDSDLYGDGRLGGQGGSGLSSMGGALVKNELTNGLPVRHALKVSLYGMRYYFEDPALPDACFRWPADRCDAAHEAAYRGTNPQLAMGALLAVPPAVRVDALGLESEAGRLMFQALQDYGAYVVGDAAVDWAIWGIEFAARTSLNERLGTQLVGWERDVNRLLPLLQVVTNNGPTSIGGGGVPRQPLAPPIGN